MSAVRQNFSAECEQAINKHINLELYACYVYHSMSSYFHRAEIALMGFSDMFKDDSEEERQHAEKLMKYLNKRGGRVVLADIKRPDKDEWGSGLDALQAALDLEKKVNESLLALHALATASNDSHLTDFLEGEYLDEQVSTIYELGVMITKLKRAGVNGLGLHLFDQELKEKKKQGPQ